MHYNAVINLRSHAVKYQVSMRSYRMNVILKSQAGGSRVDHWGCISYRLAFSLTKRNLYSNQREFPSKKKQLKLTTKLHPGLVGSNNVWLEYWPLGTRLLINLGFRFIMLTRRLTSGIYYLIWNRTRSTIKAKKGKKHANKLSYVHTPIRSCK